MALLKHIRTFDITRADFQVSTRTIGLEASALGLRPGVQPMIRIYDDAIDEGIKIRNADTGKETVWYLHTVDTNEGDVQGWLFHPTPESLHQHPELAGWTVLIIND